MTSDLARVPLPDDTAGLLMILDWSTLDMSLAQ